MKQVTRDQVLPGQTFYATEKQTPLIAVKPAAVTSYFKKTKQDADRLWHVFTPNGDFSWFLSKSLVYVDA